LLLVNTDMSISGVRVGGIRVYRSQSALTDEQVQRLVPTEIACDWSGKTLPEKVCAAIALTSSEIIYRCHVPCLPQRPVGGRVNQFIDQLWEGDVAELFIRDESGGYQEFNISPCGAWWSARFKSYRQRDDSFAIQRDGVAVKAAAEDRGWSVIFRVPCGSLGAAAGDFQAGLNFAGIFGQERIHWSFGPQPAQAPDFHWQESFVVPEVVSV
jgi:hypothetical protein